MNVNRIMAEKHTDERGYLVEFLKEAELTGKLSRFGQIYFVTFERRGIVRGNHYHTDTCEWFGVTAGKLEVVVEDVNTRERDEFVLDSEDRKVVRLYVGENVAHAFKSLSDTAVMLNYTNRQYDPTDPDRHFYGLMEPGPG